MEQKAAIRGMQAQDITAVLGIQSRCYDASKQESGESFQAKLGASPSTCFIAVRGEVPAGYLVAVPAEAGSPPPLNGASYPVPPAANALYLHDLAVHPDARGAGVAGALIDAYLLALRRLRPAFACLTAVNGTGPFWGRFGFRPVALAGTDPDRMRTYGEGALYMSMRVDH